MPKKTRRSNFKFIYKTPYLMVSLAVFVIVSYMPLVVYLAVKLYVPFLLMLTLTLATPFALVVAV